MSPSSPRRNGRAFGTPLSPTITNLPIRPTANKSTGKKAKLLIKTLSSEPNHLNRNPNRKSELNDDKQFKLQFEYPLAKQIDEEPHHHCSPPEVLSTSPLTISFPPGLLYLHLTPSLLVLNLHPAAHDVTKAHVKRGMTVASVDGKASNLEDLTTGNGKARTLVFKPPPAESENGSETR